MGILELLAALRPSDLHELEFVLLEEVRVVFRTAAHVRPPDHFFPRDVPHLDARRHFLVGGGRVHPQQTQQFVLSDGHLPPLHAQPLSPSQLLDFADVQLDLVGGFADHFTVPQQLGHDAFLFPAVGGDCPVALLALDLHDVGGRSALGTAAPLCRGYLLLVVLFLEGSRDAAGSSEVVLRCSVGPGETFQSLRMFVALPKSVGLVVGDDCVIGQLFANVFAVVQELNDVSFVELQTLFEALQGCGLLPSRQVQFFLQQKDFAQQVFRLSIHYEVLGLFQLHPYLFQLSTAQLHLRLQQQSAHSQFQTAAIRLQTRFDGLRKHGLGVGVLGFGPADDGAGEVFVERGEVVVGEMLAGAEESCLEVLSELQGVDAAAGRFGRGSVGKRLGVER